MGVCCVCVLIIIIVWKTRKLRQRAKAEGQSGGAIEGEDSPKLLGLGLQHLC